MVFELWDPWADMRRVRHRMQGLWPELPSAGASGLREPLIDVKDKGDSFELNAELPGVDKKDIKINVDEDSVSIGAEQKSEAEDKGKGDSYCMCERSYSSFFRRIPLPAEVIPSQSSAEYRNGILRVSLKKKAPSKPENKSFKLEVR